MRASRLILVALLLAAAPVLAQETQPGDACTTAGVIRESGGPEQVPGRVLICDGATWKALNVRNTDGKSLFQVGYDSGVCNADKQGRLRYSSTGDPPWEYCDGADWVNFKQPRCEDDDTGECYLQISRATDDPDFLPSQIACGVNILGVVGILGTDTIPNAFTFTDLTDQPINTTVVSTGAQLNGFDCLLNVLLSGDGSPQYRTCDDINCTVNPSAWGTGTQQIAPNKFIQLRLTTPATYQTLSSASATVGGQTDTWNVTTCDGVPDAYSFSDLIDQPIDTTAESNIVQINGMSCSSTVTIGGHSSRDFRICNNADCSSVAYTWTSSSRSIDNGQYLQLRMTTSTAYSSSRSVNPDIAGVTDDWSTTTTCDNMPSNFAFLDLSNQSVSTLVQSNVVQVSGMAGACPAPITVSGGGSPEFRICNNSICTLIDHDWGSAAQQIDNNQYVQVRLTTPAVNHTAHAAQLSINTVSTVWTAAAGCNTAPVEYTTAGVHSYTIPAGCTSALVQAWGGGGGGGGDGIDGSGAGGGGAYAADTLALAGGTPYSLTVGARGNRGSNSNGTAGGDSFFDAGANVLAKGGAGGTRGNGAGGAGGTAAASIGTTKFGGGAGGNGTTNDSGGGGGGAGGSSQPGTTGNNGGGSPGAGGAGGAIGGGNGGVGGNGDEDDGDDGTSPGGGGGGSGEDARGGYGGVGKITISAQP